MSSARPIALAHAYVCDCHDRVSAAVGEAVQVGSPIQRLPEAHAWGPALSGSAGPILVAARKPSPPPPTKPNPPHTRA